MNQTSYGQTMTKIASKLFIRSQPVLARGWQIWTVKIMATNQRQRDESEANEVQTGVGEENSLNPKLGNNRDRTNGELLESAQRLLAFRLTSQILRGSRTLRYWPDMTNPAKRFELLFAAIQRMTSELSKEGVDTANTLLFDGFVGTCEDLVRAADLLSR